MNVGPQRPEERHEEIKALAKARGGKCLSHYRNSYTPVALRCKEGHTFSLKPKHVKGGCWCPVCTAADIALRELEQKERVLAYIAKKGGTMFGPYKNARTKITVECAHGHRWTPFPDNLTSKSTWCPYCRSRKPRKRRSNTGSRVPILL